LKNCTSTSSLKEKPEKEVVINGPYMFDENTANLIVNKNSSNLAS
jgi:hypothetical protein